MKKNKSSKEDIIKVSGVDENMPAIPEWKDAKAKKELRKAVNDKINELGWLLTDAADYDEAKTVYESLSAETHLEVKIVGLTRIFIEKKQFDYAKELLEKGMKQFPGSSFILNNFGLLHYNSGNNYEALRYFDEAIQCEGKGAESSALYNKGLALLALEYYEEASKVFSKLVQIDEKDGSFFYQQGYCQLRRENYWDAIQLFRHSSSLGYRSSGLPAGLCCAFVGAGLLLEAWGIAAKGLDEYPDCEAMYENLAEVRLDLGHLDDAKDVLRGGLGKFPESEALKKLLWRAEGAEKSSFSRN